MLRDSGTALWQGFDVEWSNTPHRLKHLASGIDGIHVRDGVIEGRCRSRATVGKVPDRGVVRTRVGGLRSCGARFLDGSVSGIVRAERGEKARFDGEPVVVDLCALGPIEASAVLRGFDLACLSHDGGIHPQGLSVGLCDLSFRDGVLRFRPRAWLRANASPDPVTGWQDSFRFRVEVLYTVIAGAGLAITQQNAPCVRVEHRRRERVAAQAIHRGRGGFASSAIGVRGFRWDQRHHSYFGRNGRFVRRLQAQLGDHAYDSASGKCSVASRLWFSNDGLLPWPSRSEHRLWTTLIEHHGAPAASLVVEQPVRTGLELKPLETPFVLQAA